MWPLLFATLMLPGATPAPGAVVPAAGAEAAMPATGLAVRPTPRRAALDDGTKALSAARRFDRTARRRRSSRLLRPGISPRPRTLRLAGLDRGRDLEVEAAIRIQRSMAVARGVARLARRAHTPQRVGSADARPPAA